MGLGQGHRAGSMNKKHVMMCMGRGQVGEATGLSGVGRGARGGGGGGGHSGTIWIFFFFDLFIKPSSHYFFLIVLFILGFTIRLLAFFRCSPANNIGIFIVIYA